MTHKDPHQWAKIKAPNLKKGALARELEVCKRVNDYYHGEVPVLATVFSPFIWMGEMTGGFFLGYQCGMAKLMGKDMFDECARKYDVSNINAIKDRTWAARGKKTSWDGNFTITGEKGCLTLDADGKVYFYPHEKAETVVLDTSSQKGLEVAQPEMEYTEMEYDFHDNHGNLLYTGN